MFLTTGTVVDEKFVIRSVIGYGGAGVVYEAEQPALSRIVALKMLTKAHDSDREELIRFEREAIAISRLIHPNIVGFYTYGVWNNTPYLAMERLDGKSLQEMLSKNEPLNTSVALDVMTQLCAGLHHAHQQAVFHRDVKPSNIIVDEAGLVKIIDFGLAKLASADGVQKLTQTGAAIGSLLYMSPEQCLGQKPDSRTDIYAIGAVLYHCLTGQPPFLADNGPAVMFQQMNEPIAATPSWNMVASPFQKVIAKCMDKAVQNRYSSAESVREDLERIRVGSEPQLEGLPADPARRSNDGLPRAKNTIRPKLQLFTGLTVVAVFAIGLCYKAPVAKTPTMTRTPYETIGYYNHMRKGQFTPADVAELTEAINTYKQQPERERKALALAYCRLINYYWQQNDQDKIQRLASECYSEAGLPDEVNSGVGIAVSYHDALRRSDTELSAMPCITEALAAFKDRAQAWEISELELRLAEDYLRLGKRSEAIRLLDAVTKRGVSDRDVLLFHRSIKKCKLKPRKLNWVQDGLRGPADY